MCDYKYASSDENCRIVRLLIAVREAKITDTSDPSSDDLLHLSSDADNKCIFHTRDLDYKRSVNFIDALKNLITLWDRAINCGIAEGNVIDLEGVCVVGQETELTKDLLEEIADLSETSVGNSLSFIDGVFHATLWLTASTFKGTVLFNNCYFNRRADFSQIEFSTEQGRFKVVFSGSTFVESVGFRATHFYHSAEFEGCVFKQAIAFNETVFDSYVTFEFSEFETSLYFKKVKFLQLYNDLVIFRSCKFPNSFVVNDSEFAGEVIFEGSTILKGEFIDVLFSPYKRTNMKNLHVERNLVIKSLDGDKKTFNHQVDFDTTASNIAGQVVFENANLYHISPPEILKQLSAPAVNKIVIGRGCNKYRLRKEFEIPLTKEWRYLVEEMARTFVVFFEWRGKVPIQINVECEYFVKNMLIRYFADEDLTLPEFEALLQDQVPSFIECLKNPSGYIRNEISNRMRDPSIQDFDLFRKVQSLNYAVAPRIVLSGDWTSDDTRQLLSSLGEGLDHSLTVEIHNHYNRQFDLFTFGTKKLIAGRDINVDEL